MFRFSVVYLFFVIFTFLPAHIVKAYEQVSYDKVMIELETENIKLFKKAENTIKELSSINSDITELRHIESDYNEIQSDLKKLSLIEKDLSNFLSYLLNENENVGSKWSSKSAESVNAAITRLFSRLRKKCKNSFISLPKSSSETQNANVFQASTTNKIAIYLFLWLNNDLEVVRHRLGGLRPSG